MRLHFHLAVGLALAGSIVAPSVALADDAAAPTSITTLDLNLASIHTERWARDTLNQFNPGLGFTTHLSDTWAVSAGVYENSFSRLSAYALADYTPLHLRLGRGGWHVDAGVAGGLVSGYHSRELASEPLAGAVLLRLVSPRGFSLNVMGVPNYQRDSGFVGFQVSAPLFF
jgi:hypothetical protein